MKNQFVSKLELISQLSVPNAVIGPISLCFLQLVSLIHRREREGWQKERAMESKGGHYMSVGVFGTLADLPPGG